MYGYCLDKWDVLLPFSVQHVNVLLGKYMWSINWTYNHIMLYYLGNQRAVLMYLHYSKLEQPYIRW